jgi:hypothetical protein
MKAVVVGAICSLLTTSACAAKREWVRGHEIGEAVSDKPFSAAIRECVRAHDPSALPRLAKGGTYPVNGQLIESAHTTKVIGCMRSYGWLFVPKHIYTP